MAPPIWQRTDIVVWTGRSFTDRIEGMMHCTVKVIVGLAAAGVIGAAQAAQATSTGHMARASNGVTVARTGTSYFGATTPVGGVTVVLSRDRRKVRRVLFAYQVKCPDGTTFSVYDVILGTRIAANRSFTLSYDSGRQTDPKSQGSILQTKGVVSGVLNRRGSKIVGTAAAGVVISTSGAPVTCDSGLVPFTATD